MTRPLALVLTLVLAVTACSSSGAPTGFDQQPVPLSDDLRTALGGGVETLPVVERNFLEGCVLAETPRIEGADDLVASCRCAYDEIVAFYRANSSGETPEEAEQAAYDQFKRLDDELKSETGVIPANIEALINGCAT